MYDENPVIGAWLLPLLQAVTTGALVGLAAWAVDRLAGWELTPGWAAFALAAILSWLSYRARWEHIIAAGRGVDVSLPAVAREPTPAADTVRVELQTDGGRHWDLIDLPVDQTAAVLTAKTLTDGGSFSYSSLAGPGKPLTRSEFETLRDEFLKRGLARWKHPRAPNQGIELTAAGRAVIRKLSKIQYVR